MKITDSKKVLPINKNLFLSMSLNRRNNGFPDPDYIVEVNAALDKELTSRLLTTPVGYDDYGMG